MESDGHIPAASSNRPQTTASTSVSDSYPEGSNVAVQTNDRAPFSGSTIPLPSFHDMPHMNLHMVSSQPGLYDRLFDYHGPGNLQVPPFSSPEWTRRLDLFLADQFANFQPPGSLPGPSSSPHETSSPSIQPTPTQDADHTEAEADEKRRRNTAASARFRIKKKQRTINLERSVSDLTGRAEDLEREAAGLRQENGWLKDIVMLKRSTLTGLYPAFRLFDDAHQFDPPSRHRAESCDSEEQSPDHDEELVDVGERVDHERKGKSKWKG